MRKIYAGVLVVFAFAIYSLSTFSIWQDDAAFGAVKDPHEHNGATTTCWNVNNACDGTQYEDP